MAMKFGSFEGKDVMMTSLAVGGITLGAIGVGFGIKNSKSIKGLETQVGTITGAMACHGWAEAAPMTLSEANRAVGAKI